MPGWSIPWKNALGKSRKLMGLPLHEQRKQQNTDEEFKRTLDLASRHERYIDLRSDTEKLQAIAEIEDLTDEATNLGQQLRDVEDQDG